MPKPKPADIEGLTQLKNMLQSIRDAATGAVVLAQHVQVSVDYELELGREATRAHLARTDLRPKALIKQSGKHNYRIVLGPNEYHIGPFAGFEDMDEDKPRFYWQLVPQQPVPAASMFQALIAVVLHFCNETEPATAPVISPVDNSAT